MLRSAQVGAALVLLFVPAFATAQPRIELGEPAAARSVAAPATSASASPALRLGAPALRLGASADGRDFAARHPFALEIQHVVPFWHGDHVPLFGITFSLGLSYRIDDHFALGLGSFTLGFGGDSSGNVLVSIQGRPYVEAFVFVDPRVQLYVQLGALIEGHTSTYYFAGGVGVAADLRPGVRFWATDWLTIGLEVGMSVILTDPLTFIPFELGPGGVIGYAGLTVGFHF